VAKGTIASILIALGLDVRGVKDGAVAAEGVVEKFAGQAESRLGKMSGAWDKVGKGALALGGTLTGVGATLNGLAEPIERSRIDLETMITNTGRKFEDFAGKIDAADRAAERFGHAQSDTEEALSKLVAAFHDPQKALDEMAFIEDLAAFKHISLTDAAELDIKMHAGAGKVFKDFGINVKDAAKILAEAQLAEKNDESASRALAKAKQHLADVHAELAGKTKLTVPEQIRLRDATNAVRDATVRARDAHRQNVAAQDAAKNATTNYAQVINTQVRPHLHGLAQAQSQTFGAQLEAYKTRVLDFAGNLGRQFGPQIQIAGAAVTGLGGLIEGGEAIGRGTENIRKFAREHIVSAAKSTAAWIGHTASFIGRSAARAGAFVVEMATISGRGIATAATASARWIAHTAVFLAQSAARAGAWALEQARTIAGAIGTAAVVVGTWVAGTAVFLAQQAIRLVSWLATNAVMVATAVATGIAAAAAFLLPLLPIILIGLAIAALVILVVTHFTQIKAFITKVVAAVRAKFEADWHAITGAVAAVWNWIKSHWPLLLAIITGPIGIAVAFVVTHFTQIRAFVETVVSRIEAVFSELPGHIGSVVAQAVAWFAGLPGRLLGALGNLNQMLTNAGVQIIEGLLSGIKQKFEDVKNFVSGIGPWIQQHKGPLDVDRALLRPHGLAIMGGLHESLQRGFAPVQRFVRGVGPAIAAGVSTGGGSTPGAALRLPSALQPVAVAAGGGGMAAAGGPVSLTVNYPKPEPVSTSLNRELRKVAALRRLAR
jgi:hypothetical protein